MDRGIFNLAILLIGCCAVSVWSIPLENSEEKQVVPKSGEKGNGADADPSKEDSSKFMFQLPPFLTGARPSPVAFGNATAQGEVGGLFATNENSLFVMSGPNQNAVANLTSTAAYFAQPINDTQAAIDGGDTASSNLAGFTVTAQEDTQAYAEGEYIQFVNHGASYATGWGDSTANGTTYNPGPEPAGSGWKQPGPKAQDEKEKAGQ